MNKFIPLFLTALAVGLYACNKKAESVLGNIEYNNDPGKFPGEAKVLYLIIDGARGETLRDLKPPTIWKMRDSAVYTWNGIGDSATVDGANWANMLTGVRANKHGIIGADYSNNNLATYPVFFQRLKEVKPQLRTAAFTASPDLSEKLIGTSVTENKSLSDDAAVKNAVLAELKKDEATVVMGQFNGVANAGKQFGYDISIPAYSDAIMQVDTYVKEIMQAVYARKTYAKERWMVVVSSSRGGTWAQDAEDTTVLGNPKMNTFTLFFNSRFQSKVIVKQRDLKIPFAGKAVRLFGTATAPVNATVPNDGGLYSIGDQPRTFEFKMKLSRTSAGNYSYNLPPIFCKNADRTGTTLGWSLFKNGDNVTFYLADGLKKLEFNNTKKITDGDWHTYTLTFQRVGTTYYVAYYIDGQNKTTGTFSSNLATINSTTPLTMGYSKSSVTGTTPDGYYADVKVWDVIVPDDIIRTWAPRTYINKSHPYMDNLIGYWPCLDGAGNKFKDYSKSKKDFLINGNYAWSAFSDLSDNLFPGIQDVSLYVPNTLDIPYQILEWLNIKREDSWKLDGHSWPAEYRDYPVFGN